MPLILYVEMLNEKQPAAREPGPPTAPGLAQ